MMIGAESLEQNRHPRWLGNHFNEPKCSLKETRQQVSLFQIRPPTTENRLPTHFES
jgi:hypothetical protein